MFWTMNRRNWDPLQEIRRLQRELNDAFEVSTHRNSTEFPAVNVYNGPEDYLLTAEIPGLDPEKLDVTVLGDTVTIKGAREALELAENESYHRRERGVGQFVRSFKLPRRVDGEKVEAIYSRGILRLTLSRSPEDQPRRITLSGK